MAGLLGLDRAADFGTAETEAPDALLWVGDPDAQPDPARLLEPLHMANWHGRANELSQAHVLWPEIDSIHRTTHKPSTPERPAPLPLPLQPPDAPAIDLSFAGIARQRRSAVDFDGATHITANAFFAMLDCLLRRHATPPWNALPSAVLVHGRPPVKKWTYPFVPRACACPRPASRFWPRLAVVRRDCGCTSRPRCAGPRLCLPLGSGACRGV